METTTHTFQHVQDLWDDAVAGRLDPVGRLVYRSNLLGQDWRITNTGGGNTSAKLTEEDPLTGEPVKVLWVKGSGGDLRTATKPNFASLYQDKLLALQDVYARFEERGPKTPAEDAMVGMYPHCTFNLNPRAPSIDTPLHSFVPYKHVDHTHPVACIAIATAKNGKELTKQIYGDEVIWTDWQRPGFELGLTLQRICREHPNAKGVMLGGHGLINWADDDKACYYLSLALIEKAAAYLAEHDRGKKTFGGAKYENVPADKRDALLYRLLPWLRGRVSEQKRFIGTVHADEAVLRFVNSHDAERLAELGTSCPDHFLRTKIKPLYVDWNPEGADLDALKEKLEEGIKRYREDYKAYYEACRDDASPAMRDPNPTVVLVPGIGILAWGKTKSESRVTAEFYKAAIAVMEGAEAVSTYTALPRQEAYDIEYWALEEAKLQRMPPEAELSRRIIAIAGAGSGIGRELANRLIKEKATVVCLDLDEAAAKETAQEILDRVGMGIGVAGTGISNCGDVIGLGCDLTDRASIRAALQQAVLAYGGLDDLAVTAGIYIAPGTDGRTPDSAWAKSFAVNTLAHYYFVDEATPLLRDQDLDGSVVLTTSVNAVVAKRGSMAYDTSKAATNHLVRELAIELAPQVRVNGLAPATVVQGSSMFPRDRVLASLAKYELSYSEDEDTETLRQRLATFYAQRTLTRRPITPADQAEALFLLLSPKRLPKTTGQIVSVDGGLTEAFMR